MEQYYQDLLPPDLIEQYMDYLEYELGNVIISYDIMSEYFDGFLDMMYPDLRDIPREEKDKIINMVVDVLME